MGITAAMTIWGNTPLARTEDTQLTIAPVTVSSIATGGLLENPRIDGNRIVWLSIDPVTYRYTIYLYDVTTRTTQAIPTSVTAGSTLDIAGTYIVWSTPTTGDLYLYDLATNTQQLLQGYTTEAQISGNRVAWSSFGGDLYVCEYSPVTRTCPPQLIPAPNNDHRGAVIDGSRLVWSQADGEIYLYDLDRPILGVQRITTDGFTQFSPHISGSRIVWSDDRHSSASAPRYDAYFYDLENPVVGGRRLTPGPAIGLTAHASHARVVWYEIGSARSPDGNIFSYDLVADRGYQLTFDPAHQWVNDISGKRIVWRQDRNGNTDIYLGDLSDQFFSPNADGRQDVATMVATFNQPATWTLTIRKAVGTFMRRFSGSGTSVNQPWDGKRSDGTLAPDGPYTYSLTATALSGGSPVSQTGALTLDTVRPALLAISDSPDPFYPRNGQKTVIRFTLTEPASVTLTLTNSAGTLVRTRLAERLLTTLTGNSVVWDGKSDAGVVVPTGIYTYRLSAQDPAGNTTRYPSSGTVTVR